ncbi:MAG: MotA/TolQ/ExbB proton channel family protein [Phycisphaeraceae bacterium]|nr:MotA/TolQ/ExbB proton channel family protein [Phycisphaeraceae bacterium]
MGRLVDIFLAGGPVMWPLLAMSVLAVALCFERAAFWLALRRQASPQWFESIAEALARADWNKAADLLNRRKGPHAAFLEPLLTAGRRSADPAVIEGVARERVESLRPIVERFSVTLSAIITAAPMLGILGTVIGIIVSFQVLAGAEMRDPGAVAGGIAQALITTAFGLTVALITLFPYTAFRAQADRCFNRFEVLTGMVIAATAHHPTAAPSAKS